jgi:hypothetical protein
MSYMVRTQRVDVQWLHERCKIDNDFIPITTLTNSQAADILTKFCTNKLKWRSNMKLINHFHSSEIKGPATAADVATLLTAIGNSVGASTAPVSQVGLITVTAGAMAGTYLLINDTANAAAATDSLISIVGVTGTVSAIDFVFA